MVEQLDRSYLRKMQGEMHQCAAKCCENDSHSMQKVHSCVENCGTPLNRAQEYVQSELSRLQNRLQRCVMDCNDDAQDKLGSNPSESNMNRYGKEFDNCATKCVDSFCESIPMIEKSIKKVLTSRKFE